MKGSILCQHCCSAKLQSCAEQERGGGSVKRDRLIDLCVKGRSSAARTAASVIWLRNERPEYFMVSHQIGTGRQRSPRLIRLIFQYQIERERERERVQFSKPNTLLTAPSQETVPQGARCPEVIGLMNHHRDHGLEKGLIQTTSPRRHAQRASSPLPSSKLLLLF